MARRTDVPWWVWALAAFFLSTPVVLGVWIAAWLWWDNRECERYVADAERRAEEMLWRTRSGS